jgi:phosphatidylglycerophosphate synthase
MLDARARRMVDPPLAAVALRLHRRGVQADWLTAAGFLVGAAAVVSAASAAWMPALVLWLVNRLIDGLDGAVARLKGPSAWGGFVDIVADFAVYGGFVLGVAVAVPDALLACVALLAAYYVNGAALLAFDGAAERSGTPRGTDGRSVRFLGGLAEGTETIIVHSLFCLLPAFAAPIAWAFAAMVGLTAVWRVIDGVAALRAPRRTASVADRCPTAGQTGPAPSRGASVR